MLTRQVDKSTNCVINIDKLTFETGKRQNLQNHAVWPADGGCSCQLLFAQYCSDDNMLIKTYMNGNMPYGGDEHNSVVGLLMSTFSW